MIGESSAARSTRSSSTLQIMIFLSWHFLFFFFFINLCLFTYKSVSYYYPGYYLGWEIFSIFCYLFLGKQAYYWPPCASTSRIIHFVLLNICVDLFYFIAICTNKLSIFHFCIEIFYILFFIRCHFYIQRILPAAISFERKQDNSIQ